MNRNSHLSRRTVFGIVGIVLLIATACILVSNKQIAYDDRPRKLNESSSEVKAPAPPSPAASMDALMRQSVFSISHESVGGRSFSPTTQSVLQRRHEARRLAKTGDFEGALKELLTMLKESFAPGVNRASFSVAIFEFAKLGEVHPPALALMIDYRDSAKALMESGHDDRIYAHLVATIDTNLGNSEGSLEMLDALPADDKRRDIFAIHAFESLVDAKRYSEAGEAKHFDAMIKDLTSAFSAPFDKVGVGYEVSTVLMGAAFVEVLVGNGRYNEAEILVENLVRYDNSERSRDLIRSRIERAGGDSSRFNVLRTN